MPDTRPSPFVNRDRKILSSYCAELRATAQDLIDDPLDTDTASALIDMLLHRSGEARDARERLNLYAAKS